jgi:hypothetical protein
VLAFGTQVRGFKPGRSRRIFQGENILSTPSFGEVPCRRFTACKRSLNVTWKSGISGKIHRPFLAHIVPPLATRISRKRLVVKGGTPKNKGLYIEFHLWLRGSLWRRLAVRVGTSKGGAISLWLQYIRGISYRGPTERRRTHFTGL